MTALGQPARGLRLPLTIVLVIATAHGVAAQRASFRTFGIADGLATETITSVILDSRGFIWLGTRTGVSRFDGTRFVNYGTEHGLPAAVVNSLLEDRKGRIWAAFNGGGVARFDPRTIRHGGESPPAMFQVFSIGATPATNRVNALLLDDTDRLWAATDDGLFSTRDLDSPRFDPELLKLGNKTEGRTHGIGRLATGRGGMLWLGSNSGVLARRPDGLLLSFGSAGRTEQRPVYTMLADSRGLLWVGSDIGLFVLRPGPFETVQGRDRTGDLGDFFGAGPCRRDRGTTWRLPQAAWEACHVVLPVAFPNPNVRTLLETRTGVIAGLETGQIFDVGDGTIRALHAQADRPGITGLVEDRSGNLWASYLTQGLSRVARGGLVVYELGSELGGARIRTILGERAGALMLATGRLSVFQFEHARFSTVPLQFPSRVLLPPWASELLDHRGDLWIGTGQGLFRFPVTTSSDARTARAPTVVYTTREGLATDALGMLFEDSDGNVWIGTGPGHSEHAIARWERASGRITRLQLQGAPSGHVTSFAEDRRGRVWAAFRDGGLGRMAEGAFEIVPGTQDIVSGRLYFDAPGRLWAATLTGALRFDDPSAARPAAKRYTTREGLTSNRVNCFAEDKFGHLYVGTVDGIDRLDVASGQIRHYGPADGLPPSEVAGAFSASNGSVWFTTGAGLVELTPDIATSNVRPAVRIANVTIAGVPQPLPELGTGAAGEFGLAVSQSRIAIDFFSLSSDLVEPVRYQYRLEGLDRDWSPPTRDQSITYARLPAGTHRFAVRAVTVGGQSSHTDATVSFRVLPPLWQRWWFVSMVFAAAAAVMFAAHRYRLSHAIRLERVRNRIATDLHDDIGASLTQIAMLSDMGRSRLDAQDVDGAAERLSLIAATSRELVDTMSDIVWAVNPQRDSVNDLVYRMRRFATDTLESANISLRFVAPSAGATLRLGPNLRRELLLILKESVTNIVRHSRCTSAEIELSIERSHLNLRISDNGGGFDVAAATSGNGLRNLRRRIDALGGTLTIHSAPGHGAEVVVAVPVS